MRRVLAAAALTAALTPVGASADPVPDPPPLPVHTFCSVYWQPYPIFTDDVPVQVYVPRLAC